MKHMVVGICVLVLLAASGCSPRQAAADVERELTALGNQWNDAYIKGDVAVLERVEADDIIQVDTDGNLFTKADDIAEVKAGIYKVKSWTREEMTIRPYGETAVVNGIARIQGTYKGRDFDNRSRSTEMWMKKDGRWQCVSGQSTRITGDPGAAKAEVNALLDKLEQANETGDLALLAEAFSHDPEIVILGTDAAERWVGYGPFAEATERMFKSFADTEIVSRDRVIQIASTGNAAWFSEIWDQSGKAQGRRYAVTGLRLSGAAERQAGKWVVTQWHGSIPVAGQAVKY
jgi:ketosteroid isomerase-like protein